MVDVSSPADAAMRPDAIGVEEAKGNDRPRPDSGCPTDALIENDSNRADCPGRGDKMNGDESLRVDAEGAKADESETADVLNPCDNSRVDGRLVPETAKSDDLCNADGRSSGEAGNSIEPVLVADPSFDRLVSKLCEIGVVATFAGRSVTVQNPGHVKGQLCVTVPYLLFAPLTHAHEFHVSEKTQSDTWKFHMHGCDRTTNKFSRAFPRKIECEIEIPAVSTRNTPPPKLTLFPNTFEKPKVGKNDIENCLCE
jgi:hypothetical protein